MYFFEKNEAYRNRVHCIDETGAGHTYGQVWEIGDTAIARVPQRSLVLLLAGNNVRSVSCYLALLRKRCPVILMGQHADARLILRMVQTYRPDYIAGPEGVQRLRDALPKLEAAGAESAADPATTGVGTGSDAGAAANSAIGADVSEDTHTSAAGSTGASTPEAALIYRDLGLLLSTSGSTGAQKLVRLSYDNLQANCDSIVEYLGLTEGERPITTLPMEYTYGLSVIHSHTAVGASIILTDRTLFEPGFWELAEGQKATSMAGVPYTYEMLQRLRFQRMDLPALTNMTQAGGHLKAELQESYGNWARETGRRFFVMYGQTEATARMSYIPWDKCLDKIGSIGIPVPGGRIELLDEAGETIKEPNVSGELIYYGANVSLGYATCREDLGKGDENQGRLETGDMAYVDGDGYYFITGRKKRFVKLYGKRFSLDQIQDELQEDFDTSDMVCTGDDTHGITVWRADRPAGEAGAADEDALLQLFWDRWGIRENMVQVRHIDAIPRNPSGKIIFADLEKTEK